MVSNQNRKAACGQYKEEILSQLREMAKSEPGYSDFQGDIEPFMQFQSLLPEQDLQPGDRYDGFDRGSELATVPNYKVKHFSLLIDCMAFSFPLLLYVKIETLTSTCNCHPLHQVI